MKSVKFDGKFKEDCKHALNITEPQNNLAFKLFADFLRTNDKELNNGNEAGVIMCVLGRIVSLYYDGIKGNEEKVIEAVRKALPKFSDFDLENMSDSDVVKLNQLSDEIYDSLT
jgi:hypothetical protein